MKTLTFNKIIPCVMHKVGMILFLCSFQMIDAFTSLGASFVLCPGHEYFTFGTKVPAQKPKPSMLPIQKSRLEYQARTTVVNVKMVKPGFFDAEKKVLYLSEVMSLLARQP